MLFSKSNSLFVTRIRVTNHAQARVAGEHAFEAPLGFVGAIGHHYHSGMLRITDADTSAVVDGDPGGAGGGVDQRVARNKIEAPELLPGLPAPVAAFSPANRTRFLNADCPTGRNPPLFAPCSKRSRLHPAERRCLEQQSRCDRKVPLPEWRRSSH
jgi:hypothetical protein